MYHRRRAATSMGRFIRKAAIVVRPIAVCPSIIVVSELQEQRRRVRFTKHPSVVFFAKSLEFASLVLPRNSIRVPFEQLVVTGDIGR